MLVTNSVPVVISFAIGDRRYDVGPIALQANTAPFLIGDEAYLPMRELLRSLDLALRQDGSVAILQPQLSSLDVRQQGERVTLLAHGGAVLHARIAQQTPDDDLLRVRRRRNDSDRQPSAGRRGARHCDRELRHGARAGYDGNDFAGTRRDRASAAESERTRRAADDRRGDRGKRGPGAGTSRRTRSARRRRPSPSLGRRAPRK